MLIPSVLNTVLKFGKKFFNKVRIWRIRCERKQLNTSRLTHSHHSLQVVNTYIIHDKDGIRLLPSAAVVQQLVNEILKGGRIC